MGGEYLLKLNISLRPIANKYREGKLQRTLKRELKEPETGNGEGFGRSAVDFSSGSGVRGLLGEERVLTRLTLGVNFELLSYWDRPPGTV